MKTFIFNLIIWNQLRYNQNFWGILNLIRWLNILSLLTLSEQRSLNSSLYKVAVISKIKRTLSTVVSYQLILALLIILSVNCLNKVWLLFLDLTNYWSIWILNWCILFFICLFLVFVAWEGIQTIHAFVVSILKSSYRIIRAWKFHSFRAAITVYKVTHFCLIFLINIIIIIIWS